jgi:uncharacterized protein YdhG (YjbR/CyaY superfamily)
MNEGTGKRTTPASVEDYLASIPENARSALENLRKIIKKRVPEAVETISYQIPTFKYNGRMLVAYSAHKNHCSLHLMSKSLMSVHKEELKSYDTTTASIHFTLDHPLPTALVNKLIKARINENEAKRKNKSS